MKNMREQVVTILTSMEKDESYIQLILKEELEKVEERDRALANEIVYGTTKYRLKLDYIIDQFSKTPVKKMKPFIRHLMRMSVYQLIFLDKIPDSAVINEAVKLIHKRKMSNLSGFVNGVLRNIARGKEAIIYPNRKENLKKHLSVMYSVPEWIVEKWLKAYGEEGTEKILIALNERAKVCIRHNDYLVDESIMLTHLEEEGIKVLEKGIVKEAYLIQSSGNIGKSPSFNRGEWTVQDESAMLVGHVVAPESGESILDMCSAPGGKTTHLATLMSYEGEVIATDVHEHKIEIIRKNAERLEIDCIEAVLQDGTVRRADWHEKFDRILLDAPCSGLGIIKRKPDIRYSKTEEDVKEIVALQKQLMENAVYYLKPGGILVYSTCTLNPDENEGMVRFATEELGVTKSPIERYIPACLKSSIKDNAYIEILPYVANSDGFFIARFEKRGK